MKPEPRHGNVAIFVPHAGCPHRCAFCNQNTISGADKPPAPQEVTAILARADREVRDKAHTEIAFFGGSFTALPGAYMCSLLQAADPYTGEGGFAGVRVSTRPDAVDREILAVLKAHRVTAVELGAQSMDDGVLEKNGRGHTADDVRRAARLIRAEGFSLGLQMMLGLYGDTPGGPERTAEEFAALQPDTVRIYPTVVLRGTRLAALYYGNEYEPMELREAVELGARLLTFFGERGIRVIRMGLHASKELEAQRLAGPYHPAYRELCESRIYLARALEALRALPQGGGATLFVNPRAVSKLVGQHRSNLRVLAECGYTVRVRGDRTVEEGSVRAEQDTVR